MPVWKASSIEERPSVTLTQWQVFEVRGIAEDNFSTVHFVGYNIEEQEGRVSSPVVEFDVATRRGFTQSGRIYELCGASGVDADAAYTWGRWKKINDITDAVDITSSFVVKGMRRDEP